MGKCSSQQYLGCRWLLVWSNENPGHSIIALAWCPECDVTKIMQFDWPSVEVD